jgi:putative hydrolase of the HAD superfamily
MFNPNKIKGILFDYGGTIDTNGIHWSEIMWESYQVMRLPVDKETFRKAYIHGERTLLQKGKVAPNLGFWRLIVLKAEIQLRWLQENKYLAEENKTSYYATKISERCFYYAQITTNALRFPILKRLSERYPLVLVSNFYGNLHAVLRDFLLNELFSYIIESAEVGIRKPDPAIYRMAIEKLKLPPHNIVVIGDSYHNDILPASSLGCNTIWLKKTGWEKEKGNETAASLIISDLAELKDIFHL